MILKLECESKHTLHYIPLLGIPTPFKLIQNLFFFFSSDFSIARPYPSLLWLFFQFKHCWRSGGCYWSWRHSQPHFRNPFLQLQSGLEPYTHFSAAVVLFFSRERDLASTIHISSTVWHLYKRGQKKNDVYWRQQQSSSSVSCHYFFCSAYSVSQL